MTEYDFKILSVLSPECGVTTEWIRKTTGISFGHNARTTSGAIRSWLNSMKRDGLVDFLDDLKPVCWKITDSGRAALKEHCNA